MQKPPVNYQFGEGDTCKYQGRTFTVIATSRGWVWAWAHDSSKPESLIAAECKVLWSNKLRQNFED